MATIVLHDMKIQCLISKIIQGTEGKAGADEGVHRKKEGLSVS